MRRLGFVIFVALAGCSDREAAELERAKDSVCGCVTQLGEQLAKGPSVDVAAARAAASACADRALKEVPQGEVRSSHRSQKIAREMLDCLAKIYERPADNPDTADETKPMVAPGTAGPASAASP